CAYKALEDALEFNFHDKRPQGNLDPREGNVSDVANQSAKNAGKSEEIARALAPEPGPKSPSHKPANDQRPTANVNVGRSLEPHRTSSALRIAAIVSVLWVAACAGLAHLMFAPQIWQIRSLQDLETVPGALAILVAAIFPIFVFFAFATMIARAQELR